MPCLKPFYEKPLIMTLSIRTLILALVAACLLPLAGLLAYTVVAEEKQVMEVARHQARTLAMASAANIGTTLAGAKQSLDLLATRPGIRAFDARQCDPLFGEYRSLFPQFANVLAVDVQGRAVCSGVPQPGGVPTQLADGDWFRQVSRMQAFTVGKPYWGPITGRWVSVLVQPVFDAAHRTLGYVALPLDLQKYVPYLAGAPLPAGTRVGILSGDGVMVWRNEDPDHSIGKYVGDRGIVARLLAMRDGNLDGVGSDGVARLYAIAQVGAGDLYVYVGVPAEAAQWGALSRAGRAAAAALVLFLLAGALAFMAARRIIRPVLALTEAARALGGGDTAARAEEAGPREIRELARVFNRMVRDWQEASAQWQAAAAEVEDLYQHAPCGYHSLDRDGRLVRINDTLLGWLGYAREDVLGKALWRDFCPPASQALVDACFPELVQSGKIHDLELDLRCKDGSIIHVLLNSTAVRDDQGAFLWSRSVTLDITERKAAEEQRAQVDRQLQQVQKMEALGRLTGGIAHDFNNILGAILGFSRLALKRHVPDQEGKLAHFLNNIVTAAERARDLVAKMMAYSRTDGDEGFDAILPAQVVREVATLLTPTLPAGIVLKVEADEVPAIGVSAGDVHQLVMNLVINARDAVGEYGRIGVRLHAGALSGEHCAMCREAVEGEFVILEVSDSGFGIPPATLPHIFDPFFTTKDVGKGTGLGLSVVQGIVRKAGGHALVASQEGKGTTFRLVFPLVKPPQNAASTLMPAPATAAPVGKRVWVVDDEPVLLDYLKEVFESEGYVVCCFQDPTVAARAYRKDASAVDLVVTDQTMPLIGGADLARTMLMRRPELPVILCTGYSEYVDEAESRRIGIRCFFRKPVDPDVMLAAVARELAGTKRQLATVP